eukprot:Gregarina_sp_Poly_1__7927@NODE_4526_length_568_cov_18_712575_g3043_i0_p1_GENE_NODE_4526_length_568_cov_18_712575_g3043_i0NODE_4526_length_568_cov_18_712575_g3043_i0_p1_ORF_typecomplete_len128_score16_59_NODE_4526_length_568_cov_18_712575_g3043_i052435
MASPHVLLIRYVDTPHTLFLGIIHESLRDCAFDRFKSNISWTGTLDRRPFSLQFVLPLTFVVEETVHDETKTKNPPLVASWLILHRVHESLELLLGKDDASPSLHRTSSTVGDLPQMSAAGPSGERK